MVWKHSMEVGGHSTTAGLQWDEITFHFITLCKYSNTNKTSMKARALLTGAVHKKKKKNTSDGELVNKSSLLISGCGIN